MVINQGRPAEEGSADVVILITDGQSSSSTRTIQAADRARDRGITIFYVTVGNGFSATEVAGVTDNDPNLRMALSGESMSHTATTPTCAWPFPVSQ